MNNEILDIIRIINGGNILNGIDDKNSKKLINDKNELYISNTGNYYFFSKSIDDNNIVNISDIEYAIQENELFNCVEKPKPSDSYLIMIWKVDKIDESIYPIIIETEENEFLFKKYVFYYTEEEIQQCKHWLTYTYGNNVITTTQLLNDLKTIEGKPEYQFLTRLLIKLPYIELSFEKIEHKEFQSYVSKQLNGIQKNKNKDEILSLNEKLNLLLQQFDDEQISEKLFNELLEKNDDRL